MKTIEEKNRMIAEFMGVKVSYVDNDKVAIIDGKWVDFCDLEYHTSWEWLMPVVEKIESYDMNVKIHTSYTSIHFKRKQCIVDVDGRIKIENTYSAVVQFIEWYNENK